LSKEEERVRHNSWHNLVQLDPGWRLDEVGDDVGPRPPPPSRHRRSGGGGAGHASVSVSGGGGELNLTGLVDKQEDYIRQLENENEFCRQQVKGVMSLLKGGGENDDNLLLQMQSLRQENVELKKAAAAAEVGPSESTRKLIDGLRQDNEMLRAALSESRGECEELARKEGEAVEQVRRSVEVAEQLRMERGEMEYEMGQLKMQAERMQMRIHAMVEEQADAVEKERLLIEKHFQGQAQHLREEFDRQAGELGKAKVEIDGRQRVEEDLIRRLAEKDRALEAQQLDHDKQLSSLRSDLQELAKIRQKLELDLNGVTCDLDNANQTHQAEAHRLQEEVRSAKARLNSAQDNLQASRQECLTLAEVKAALERQVNHLKVRGPLPSMTLTGGDDELPTRDTDKVTEEGLKVNLYQMAQKQNVIIQELKGQCHLATDKIESLVKQFTKEKEQYEYSLSVLAAACQQANGSDKCPKCNGNIPPSDQTSSQTYEQLCRKMEELQKEKSEALRKIRQLKSENRELQLLQNQGVNHHSMTSSPHRNNSAITIIKSSRPNSLKKI